MDDARLYEVRLHGRGGQGAVTAAELLSVAAFDAGLRAQAFPSFGSERTGAPVEAYCRFGTRPIRLREPVLEPDAVIVLDATLLRVLDVVNGLRHNGLVVVNSLQPAGELELDRSRAPRVVTLPASDIARRHIGRPLTNGVMLGAFAALCEEMPLAPVLRALRERFPDALGEVNAAAAQEAYDLVLDAAVEAVHA